MKVICSRCLFIQLCGSLEDEEADVFVSNRGSWKVVDTTKDWLLVIVCEKKQDVAGEGAIKVGQH